MYSACVVCKKLEQETSFYRCTLHAKTVYNPNMAGCGEGNRQNEPAMPPLPTESQTLEEIYLSFAG
jgi:hypothetical protein